MRVIYITRKNAVCFLCCNVDEWTLSSGGQESTPVTGASVNGGPSNKAFLPSLSVVVYSLVDFYYYYHIKGSLIPPERVVKKKQKVFEMRNPLPQSPPTPPPTPPEVSRQKRFADNNSSLKNSTKPEGCLPVKFAGRVNGPFGLKKRPASKHRRRRSRRWPLGGCRSRGRGSRGPHHIGKSGVSVP